MGKGLRGSLTLLKPTLSCPRSQMAEITKAQDSVVPVTMPDVDPEHMAPKVEGVPEKKTTYPVQLYCRARPWFQVRCTACAQIRSIA